MKPILFNFTDPELEKFLLDMGQPKFRARQIRDWLTMQHSTTSVI